MSAENFMTQETEAMLLDQRVKSHHNNGNGWKRICIPVDNSEQSQRTIDLGVSLARHFNYGVSGIHVFNFELHRKRFRALIPYLPERFRTRITEKMENTHDAIMDLSFKHLGREFLEVLRVKAESYGTEFEGEIIDGNPAKEIERYVNKDGCDLVMMGSSGQGKSPRIGGCARKIARRIRKDII
ncbi:MAG: universal stress protein, partial [Thermodesulfobacteriota bacterium]